MRTEYLRKFMERGAAAQQAVNTDLHAYSQREQPRAAWHRFAVQIELRARTLRASIRAHDNSSEKLRSLIDVLEIEATKLRQALEVEADRAARAPLSAEQHAAFPNGRWARGGGK